MVGEYENLKGRKVVDVFVKRINLRVKNFVERLEGKKIHLILILSRGLPSHEKHPTFSH